MCLFVCLSKWKTCFTMSSIVQEWIPDHTGGSRALYHSATSPTDVDGHEWYWVVDWQAACSISWSSFPLPLQHDSDWTSTVSADWTGWLPVNKPLISNHSSWGCSAVVKCSTPTDAIRVRFPDDAGHCEKYFPFWRFWTNLVQTSLQEAKFDKIGKK